MRTPLLPLLCCGLLLATPGVLRAAEDSDAGRVEPVMDEPMAEDAGDRRPGDPWEPLNRRIFAFNETLDRWVLEPVAIGWDFVLPDPVETGIDHFFENLALPIRFANDVLQAKPLEAYETLWRAVINTTVGLGGFFDPASAWTVHKSDEDFGQTLGRWGTPPGPYLVLPLFGPSNPRDTAGRVVDGFGAVYTYFVPFYVPIAANTVNVVNTRAGVLEDVRAERAAAFDFYSAVRSAYTQYRENQVRDRAEDERHEQEDEDLYYLDEEDEGPAPKEDDDV